MVTRIKRVAQFLFDNAELIAEFLQQSGNFRTVEVDIKVHKAQLPAPELDIGLTIYDEVSKLYDLENHRITKERFTEICNTINEETGVTELPEPIEVRDKLEQEE